MTQEVIPTFATDLLPPSQGSPIVLDQVQGVYFLVEPEITETILAKVARWFDSRSEVRYVDHGTTDKQGDGYIILEWIGREIDPLFLAILRDDELVIDYTPYIRTICDERGSY